MSIFRPLYDLALRHATKPYAQGLLFLIAVTEPCLSPIPPDVLMIPMALAHRERAMRFAMIAVIGLVLGSVAGYGIGAVGMYTIGQWLVSTYDLQDEFAAFSDIFKRWGYLILIAKGFVPLIPVPLIVLMVASGAAHLNFPLFLLTVGASQAVRLLLEAWLIHCYGEPVRNFIERYLTWIGFGVVACVGAFAALFVGK